MIALNTQKPEPYAHVHPDGSLEVFKIFPTIQGEGPFTGTPAIFVRLAGCNLFCSQCDTDYTSSRIRMTPKEILGQIKAIGSPAKLIVLTGGEPFRQGIGPLCIEAIAAGYEIQIETNGSLFQYGLPYGDPRLTIVCSPKTPKVHPSLAGWINAYKYVLDAKHVGEDGLPMESMGTPMRIGRPDNKERPIYVQPLDVQDPIENKKNIDACIASCLKHGYRLSFQIHKLIGVE